MINDALDKIKNEIAESKNNPYVQAVGNFLLNHLDQHPEDAEKVLVKEKTIGKSLDTMRTAASKKKVGNVAVLTEQEGFEVVLGYFGIKKGVTTNVLKEPAPVVAPRNGDFDVKLDDFL